MKILIASKVGFIRHTLQRGLKQDGHRVTTTDSLQNTLEMIRNDCQIDIVVADWATSEMSATEVIRSIRRVERMSDLGKASSPYVFVLTNPAESSDVDEDAEPESGLMLAFGEVFVKPVNMQLLRQRVHAYAEARRAPEPDNRVQPAADPRAERPVPPETPPSDETPAPGDTSSTGEMPTPHAPVIAGLVELPIDKFSSCFD